MKRIFGPQKIPGLSIMTALMSGLYGRTHAWKISLKAFCIKPESYEVLNKILKE